MSLKIRKSVLFAGLAALVFSLPAYSNDNKSVRIDDGAESNGASTVNGSITVGKKATVTGSLSTVNGSIRVGEGSRIEDASTVNGSLRISDDSHTEDLQTVNGGIRVGEQVVVDGEITAVNGKINVNTGSSVDGEVSNVNGSIVLSGSTVARDVSTVNGDIRVVDGAVVKGDVIVEEVSNSFFGNGKKPTVVIGPGSRVEGVLLLKREVKLYISDRAEVGGVEGVMSMDDAVRFSGDRP
ncbi:MAG: hypothetical protein IID59_09015 [Proteobacteria bacterium]|nr:hypothetical protein [Pseudomonadota bacterium]